MGRTKPEPYVIKRLVAATVFVAVAIVVLTRGLKLSNQNIDTTLLRISFPYSMPANAYEPSRIHLAPEYIFLENTFSPLVEMSPMGQVEAGVAERFYWVGNSIHFVIRKSLKTISGIPITSADAAFSLKRLMLMPENTHGDFKDLICGSSDFKKMDDICAGIQTTAEELILSTTNAGRTFLLPMLVAADFSIIPRSSVDPHSFKIINYRETSGPYFVSMDDLAGHIRLTANPAHYHYSKSIPQNIELVPASTTDRLGSIAEFESHKIDFITTVDLARADEIISYSKNSEDSVLHKTLNIRSFILKFTERGLRELTRQQRISIGNAARSALVSEFAGKDGFEASKQFFPSFGDGALNEDELKNVAASLSSSGSAGDLPKLKMSLVRLGDVSRFVIALQKGLPEVEIKEGSKNPEFLKYSDISDMPHMSIIGPDTGFQEDIGLITYSLNAGYFGMTKQEREAWLLSYMGVENKFERLDLLKRAQISALEAPIIVPLLTAPYAALARKPWKIELSQLYANNQLWLLHKN
jgi:hypothetical protein